MFHDLDRRLRDDGAPRAPACAKPEVYRSNDRGRGLRICEYLRDEFGGPPCDADATMLELHDAFARLHPEALEHREVRMQLEKYLTSEL